MLRAVKPFLALLGLSFAVHLGAASCASSPEPAPDGEPAAPEPIGEAEEALCICPQFWICCNGVCRNPYSDEFACGHCNVICFNGTTCCFPGHCVDTTSDSNNCGGCGIACTGGQTCQNSQCACPAGTIMCSGQCVNLSSNFNNCGTCGHACSANQACCGGVCSTLGGHTQCASCTNECGPQEQCCHTPTNHCGSIGCN